MEEDERRARRGARRAVAAVVLALFIALGEGPFFTSITTLPLGVIAATVAIGLAAYGVMVLRHEQAPSLQGVRRLGLGLAAAVVVVVLLCGLYAGVNHAEWQRQDEIERNAPWPH